MLGGNDPAFKKLKTHSCFKGVLAGGIPGSENKVQVPLNMASNWST